MPDLSPIGNEATAMSYAELVVQLNKVRAQLLRMVDGATFVQDGHVRVTDPVYLLECLAEAATAIETLERERDEARREFAELAQDVKESLQGLLDRYKETP